MMHDVPSFPATGQQCCYDSTGAVIDCVDSGQDAEIRSGVVWPDKRFQVDDNGQVLDRLTGLTWSQDANPAEYPMDWEEAMKTVVKFNMKHYLGASDWRMPNRRELRSLVSHQTARPALPVAHPFQNVFASWYWSSTSYAGNPAHAWYVHMDGARMFYGGKDQAFLLWPVRGEGNGLLARTGQYHCFNSSGDVAPCQGNLQDGALRYGRIWPQPRFLEHEHGILDRLTDLIWQSSASLTQTPVNWTEGLMAIAQLNAQDSVVRWHLPNILELESLTDCSCSAPALPSEAGFSQVQSAYWSSTTSAYEPDWAWVLYLDKGAVGVGQKAGPYFHVWAVSRAPKTQA